MYGLRSLINVNNDTNIDALKYYEHRMSELIDENFNSESISTENSPSYHQYIVSLFNIIPAQYLSNNKNLLEKIKKAHQNTPWLADSKGVFFQIGDSEGNSKSSLDYKRIDADFYVDDMKCISKLFFESGYFISKVIDSKSKSHSEFIFYNTTGSYIHKHLDGNSFIFVYKDIELFADAGKHSYDYNEFNTYFRSLRAHNTVYPEGVSLKVDDLDLFNTRFLYNSFTNYYHLSSIVKYYEIFNHIREVSFFPNNKLLIKDKIDSNLDCDNVLNFLFGPEIKVVDLIYKGYILLQSGTTPLAKIILQKGFLSYEINVGLDNPYRGWMSKEYSKSQPVYFIEVIYPKSIEIINTEIILIK